jgi:hypothetical protein
MLHGEVEVVHVERIVAAASKDDAVKKDPRLKEPSKNNAGQR